MRYNVIVNNCITFWNRFRLSETKAVRQLVFTQYEMWIQSWICHCRYGIIVSNLSQFKVPTICFRDSLTHWGRVTHICVSRLTITGSDNGLSPCRRQAITWTNDGILLIGPLGTNFSEILIENHTFSFKKIHLKCPLEMAAILSRPQCVKRSFDPVSDLKTKECI